MNIIRERESRGSEGEGEGEGEGEEEGEGEGGREGGRERERERERERDQTQWLSGYVQKLWTGRSVDRYSQWAFFL